MPHIISFDNFGSDSIGFLSVAESLNLGFEIKRAFWVYGTPTDTIRGRHAHHQTKMVIIALKGEIKIECIGKYAHETFTLSNPNQGLFIPELCWHNITHQNDAIQLVLASTDYDNDDYIRDFDQFKKFIDKI
jgi:dTDP-4-dehydrorhamnose 3,5-epimerase-like enzyme